MRLLAILALAAGFALAQDDPTKPGCCKGDKVVEKDKAGCCKDGAAGEVKEKGACDKGALAGEVKDGCCKDGEQGLAKDKEGCCKDGEQGLAKDKEGCCKGAAVEVCVPVTGLADDAQKLGLVRELLRKGVAINDFDFRGDVLVLSLQPGASVTVCALDGSVAEAKGTIDREAFILPAKVSLDIEGMTCMGCANGVTKILESHPGTKVVKVELGRADVVFTADTRLAQLDALFAGHAKFKVAAVHFGRALPIEAAAATTEAPALVLDKPAQKFANEVDANGKYLCPVSGNPIAQVTPEVESMAVKHGEKVWLVCCKGCVGKLMKKLN